MVILNPATASSATKSQNRGFEVQPFSRRFSQKNRSREFVLRIQGVTRMAERQGFEPWLPFRVNTLSKRAPSATRPSLRRESIGKERLLTKS